MSQDTGRCTGTGKMMISTGRSTLDDDDLDDVQILDDEDGDVEPSVDGEEEEEGAEDEPGLPGDGASELLDLFDDPDEVDDDDL